MIHIRPHAPGPWEVTPDGQAIKAVNVRPDMDPSELLPVAVLSPGVCRAGNARIIKAAPTLFEACRAVEEWWLREGRHHFSGAPACIFMARAAVAEVEGGPECST